MMLPAPDPDPGNAARADEPEQADTVVQAGAGSPAGTDPVDAAAGQQWSGVLAMFVDDPRGSVAEASALVDEAVDAFIAAARERQASLAASWQAQDVDTEQLRIALREYRTFWTRVTRLPQPA
jgi:hypothetical protein